MEAEEGHGGKKRKEIKDKPEGKEGLTKGERSEGRHGTQHCFKAFSIYHLRADCLSLPPALGPTAPSSMKTKTISTCRQGTR